MEKVILESILEQIEEMISLEHAAEVECLHLNAMHYKDVSRIPLSIEYPADSKFPRIPYTEVFHDPEKMLYNELVSVNNNIWNSVRLKDDYPLQIRPNYGVGIISSLFGAKIQVNDDTMPWVVPLEGEEAFRKAILHGVPEVRGGLAGKIQEAYQVFSEWLGPYPKCAKAIHLTQPDMQGPFDNLHLLRGEDVFYDLYDDPEMVHEALDIITETMISYQKSLPRLNDRAGADSYYIHRAIYKGNILIKLDTETAMISESMFEEFCKPYNQRVLDALGGGSIHFCGGGKEWPSHQMPQQNITCLNFGNPEMQDILTDWTKAREQKICFVGYGQGQKYSFLREQMERGLRTGVTFLNWADDFEEAKKALDKHRQSIFKKDDSET